MKKKKFLALFMVGLLVFTGCGKKDEPKDNEKDNDEIQQQEQPQTNTNTGVVEDKVLDEFTFTNTSMIYENGTTTLETTVTNTSTNVSYLQEFLIYVRDNQNNLLVTLKGFVGDNIAAGESKLITSNVSMDLSNSATSISYEIVR